MFCFGIGHGQIPEVDEMNNRKVLPVTVIGENGRCTPMIHIIHTYEVMINLQYVMIKMMTGK